MYGRRGVQEGLQCEQGGEMNREGWAASRGVPAFVCPSRPTWSDRKTHNSPTLYSLKTSVQSGALLSQSSLTVLCTGQLTSYMTQYGGNQQPIDHGYVTDRL